MSEKAVVLKVGTFLESGSPTGWRFGGTGRVLGMELRRGLPTLYGGYTLEELHEIARLAAQPDGEPER